MLKKGDVKVWNLKKKFNFKFVKLIKNNKEKVYSKSYIFIVFI